MSKKDFYRAFEDRYRGSRELIAERLKVYAPFVHPLLQNNEKSTALDLGCGRGEWLELLGALGLNAKGIDLDQEMLMACHELGLDVEQADIFEYISKIDNESLDMVSAFHVVEHIQFEKLQSLFEHVLRVLKPGGLLIFETPNPDNLIVGSNSFYLDPTHERPLPASLLSFLADYQGFSRVKILGLQEDRLIHDQSSLTLWSVLSGASPDYAVVAQKGGANESLLKAIDPAFDASYGITLNELASRYEQQQLKQRQLMQQQFTQQLLDQQQIEVERTHVMEAGVKGIRDELAVMSSDIHGIYQMLKRNIEFQQQVCLLLQKNDEFIASASKLTHQFSIWQDRALLAEARALTAELDTNALRSSLSWRLTSPLRYAGRVIAGLKRPKSNPMEKKKESIDKRKFIERFVNSGADIANRSPLFMRLALKIFELFPGMAIRLKRVRMEAQFRTTSGGWVNEIGAENMDSDVETSMTEIPGEYVSTNGVNSQQRSPLEANFQKYTQKK